MLLDRPTPDGGELFETVDRRLTWLTLRLGGLHAPTSMVSIATTLWFGHLDAGDRVAVCREAAPLLDAAHHLLGLVDLREPNGDNRYVDFTPQSSRSTVVAALFAARVRQLVEERFGQREPSRFVALCRGKDLDSTVVRAVARHPAAVGLGRLTWVIEIDAASSAGEELRRELRSAGWHTIELRHGRRREARFVQPSGKVLRSWLESVDRDAALRGLQGEELRKRFLDGAPGKVCKLADELEDAELAALVADVGGHDHASMLDALRSCDLAEGRPSALLVHTCAGRGIQAPGEDEPAALLEAARLAAGVTREDELARCPEYSAPGRWCSARGRLLARPHPADAYVSTAPSSLHSPAVVAARTISVPPRIAARWPARSSTVEAFDRLVGLLRTAPPVAPYLVVIDADGGCRWDGPASLGALYGANGASTGGAASFPEQRRGPPRPGQRLLPEHLTALLAQLGRSFELSGQRLLPIGTLAEGSLLEALEGLTEAGREGAGIVLAASSGAPGASGAAGAGLALELAGLGLLEPAFQGELDWLLADALARIAAGRAEAAYYLRLSARQLDQAPFESARRRLGEEALRAQVLAGAYVLSDAGALAATGAPVVELLACGAVVPEALEAADELAAEGVASDVIVMTSPGRCYRSWLERGAGGLLSALARPGAPIVTVHDAPSHVLAWVGSSLGVAGIALGADRTELRGAASNATLEDRYLRQGLLPGQIVNAALLVLDRLAR